MIEVDPLISQAIEGSFTPAVSMTAWRDGALTYPLAAAGHPPFDVISWSTTEDATQSARSCSVVVVAQEPVLVPRSVDSVLAPWASEVALQSGVDLGPELGRRLIPEGFFRITRSKPREWHEYYAATDAWVLQGLVVDVEGTDRMKVLDDARFESATTVSSGSSVYQAIAALCRDLVPVGVHLVPDRAITPMVFDSDDRVAAIDSLAKHIEARAVCDREGRLVLKPRSTGTGRWEIPDASLVDVEMELSADGFYNAVVARGRNPDTQEEYAERVIEDSGPTRYRTGHKVPYFYSSPLLTTRDATFKAARSTFENVVRRRRTVVTLDVPSHPGVEALDEVTWTRGGEAFTGSVKTVVRSGGKSDNGVMRLSVWLPLEATWRLT